MTTSVGKVEYPMLLANEAGFFQRVAGSDAFIAQLIESDHSTLLLGESES